MRKEKLGWGTGAETKEQQGEKYWGKAKRKCPQVALQFSKAVCRSNRFLLRRISVTVRYDSVCTVLTFHRSRASLEYQSVRE